MTEYHSSMQVEVEFSFKETSKGCGITYDKSGQAIDPEDPPQFELSQVIIEGIELDPNNMEIWDLSEPYEALERNLIDYISENYKKLTK